MTRDEIEKEFEILYPIHEKLPIKHKIEDIIIKEWCLKFADHILRVAESKRWRSMESAPRDGTTCLLKFKDDLAKYDPNGISRLEGFNGKQFVGRWPDPSWDCGWNFAAPVGYGGISDHWLVGWMPLPSASEVKL